MAVKKKALTKKEPVTLREKALANGNESLYLDIYRDGKREYEYLNSTLSRQKHCSTRNKTKKLWLLHKQ